MGGFTDHVAEPACVGSALLLWSARCADNSLDTLSFSGIPAASPYTLLEQIGQ
jgi:hypothetical protein